MSKIHEKAEALVKELESVSAKEESLINEFYLEMKPFQDKLEQSIAPIKERASKVLDPLETRRNQIKEELLKLASKELDKLNNKEASLFVDDNWKFDSQYYMHISRETKEDPSKDFEVWKFIKKFGEYAEVKFKIKELKKVFVDAKLSKPFLQIGFKLKTVPTVELKISKKTTGGNGD